MLTKERQVSLFPERVPESKGIEVRDNLGIETKAGVVDIYANTDLLAKDILASVERELPQFREKATELTSRLRFYLGKRPFAEVVVEELTNRGGVAEENKKLIKTLFVIKSFVSLDSTIATFFADEKCPFFHFNTPKMAEKMVKRFGKRELSEELGEAWLHERQHFVDLLDPVRRAQLYKDQEEILKLFLGIDGAVVLLTTVAGVRAVFKYDKPKITRRTFLRAGLAGVGYGALMTIAFSPFAMMISREFTYRRGHESERVARQEAKESILIAPFEDIFQIKFK